MKRVIRRQAKQAKRKETATDFRDKAVWRWKPRTAKKCVVNQRRKTIEDEAYWIWEIWSANRVNRAVKSYMAAAMMMR